MIISERLVRRYQQTYKRKFGEDISAKEAERELFDLAELIRIIVKERKSRHGN